jgi:spore coat polysaccharide biosynthesis protein SpsF
VLGEALGGAWRSRVEVITKLDPLDWLAHDADTASVRAAVDESVSRSCSVLRVQRLGTLLLHRAQHYSSWGGAAWRRLLELREEGKIGILGASVYEPSKAFEVVQDPAIQHLQIPMNVLDWRWRESGLDQALKGRPDVVVHARSALLQGLLASSAESWPYFASREASSYTREIARLATQFGREGPTDLCLAYVRSQPWIHSAVVGCETLEQVTENLRLFCLPQLSAEQCAVLERSLPRASEALLNPAQWKLAYEQSPT